MVYYNEYDRKKAAWLRELIKAGVIANGEVDERSIEDVTAADVVEFKQCHWFAGIGIWSYALRLAGWPDGRECWTLSCPCQPFSAAGKKKGIKDRRHLWPNAFGILRERCPVVCFGEQVSSPDGLTWLDIVRTDLEGAAYTFGAVDLCAAGAGAPHIRNRTFFVADTADARHNDTREHGSGSSPLDARLEQCGAVDGMANAMRPEWGTGAEGRERQAPGRNESASGAGIGGEVERLANSHGKRVRTGQRRGADEATGRVQGADGERKWLRPDIGELGAVIILAEPDGRQSSDGELQRSGKYGLIPEDGSAPGPVNGFWRESGWVLCRPERSGGDPSWRPVECGTFPLANEPTIDLGRVRDPRSSGFKGSKEARILRLRGYGDGINAEVAARFVQTYMQERGI